MRTAPVHADRKATLRRADRFRRTTIGSGAGWNPADFLLVTVVVVRFTNGFGVSWCTHDFLLGSIVWEEVLLFNVRLNGR